VVEFGDQDIMGDGIKRFPEVEKGKYRCVEFFHRESDEVGEFEYWVKSGESLLETKLVDVEQGVFCGEGNQSGFDDLFKCDTEKR
jgi:hypothetical protein